MATQTILWTVLPAGRVTEGALKGRLKVSVVASPRLTPERANERELRAFPEWLLWPRTVAEAKFGLRIGNTLLPLEPLGPLAGQAQPDVDLWSQLFAPETPVDGFVFKDMSRVNLRSYAVRNVLGLARKYYAQLAVGATSRHPTLLPWSSANPALRAMLIDMGAPREVGAERQGGFARFFNDGDGGIEQVLRNSVFGPKSKYSGTAAGIGVDRGGNPVNGASFPVRVLPPDWQPPNGTPDTELMANWASAAEYTLYQADRFYRREPLSADALAMRRPSGKDIPPPPESQTLDFHKRLASYSDYPALLRRLGVLLDFVLPAENPIDQQVRQQGNAQGTMQLDLRWANDHDPGVDGCPATAWQADSQRFTARPRTNDHHMGMLRLGGANDRWDQSKRIPFDVYQVDPDGTALKTVDFVLSAQRLIDKSRKSGTDGAVTYTTGDDQPVAALRAGGIGVSRHGRAAALAFGAASSAAKDGAVRSGAAASAGIALFTEDVLRGYRVDVQPIIGGKPGRWQSLCRRQGAYQIAATGAKLSLPADDEGYVKGASTTSTANPASGADPDDHYLHESLFRWAGWSLVVPRPGRTLRAQDGDSGVQAEVPTDVTDAVAAADGNGILTSFVAAKGSLPRLRFGFAYRLRARLVDLAGNSLDVDDPSLGDGENELEVTQPVTYWRFEPVDPPVLVQRARASEGESLERMVIRSNYDADPATFLTTGAFADAIKLPASADFAYTPANERHVVPPKASQTLCETHGLFDPMFGSASGIRDAYALAARESGTLYDAGPGTDVALITPTALANVATTVAVPPALPSLDNPTGDRLAAGQYVIHREARVPTPWLPDVAAGGIALRAAPGSRLPGVTGPMSLGAGAEIVAIPGNELVLMVAFDQRWPDTRGLRIVLAERVGLLADPPCQVTYPDDGTPRWDADARTLTFFLPKGQIARLTYASFVHPDLIGTFGLPDWVDTAAEKALLQQMALTGAAWMLTPYRPLVLVHATQQPVCTPEFLTELGKARSPGDRFAKLGARVRVHGPSTGKLELQATWTEWIDDPADAAGPRIAQCEGTLAEIALPENAPNLDSLGPLVDAMIADPTRPRARGDQHEFGDTKCRLVSYCLRATTRFREYLPAALYADPNAITRTGQFAQGPRMVRGADDDPGAPMLRAADATDATDAYTVIPASAPPDAPRVRYCVPTFRWSGTPTNTDFDTTRLGNGVRVWLDRPWFTSGEGELLGVVLPASGDFASIPLPLEGLVTQWGADPLWDSVLPKMSIHDTDFPARVTSALAPLQEAGNPKVMVVGHRVHWHAERSCWYCDIELDPGLTYMPFVRLALVRYQPNAIDEALVSKVVLCDFAQVLPRRRATFARTGAQVNVSLRGTVPAHGPMKWSADGEYLDISFIPPFGTEGETGRNKVEVVLQTRDPAIDSDLAWQDVRVLADSLLDPKAPLNIGTVGQHLVGQAPQRIVPEVLGLGRIAPPAAVTGAIGAIGTIGAIGAIDVTRPSLGDLLDPVIWSGTVTLPDVAGKPARLAIREFERYYTDRTVPEVRAGKSLRRRVVEERLVYTTFFPLA